MRDTIGKWQRELGVFRKLSSAIVLTGNIYDAVPVYIGDKPRICTLEQYLYGVLNQSAYRHVLSYDMVRGFTDLMKTEPDEQSGLEDLRRLLKEDAGSQRSSSGGQQRTDGIPYTIRVSDGRQYLVPESVEDAAHIIQLLMKSSSVPTGIIVRFATQFVARPDDLEADERRLFLFLRCASEEAKWFRDGDPNDPQYNTKPLIQNQLYLLTDKLNDLPAWFSMTFPQLKVINIERPNYRERETFLRSLAEYFPGYAETRPEEKKQFLDLFVGRTEGLTYTDLNNMRLLAVAERIPVREAEKLIMLYRHGVYENPWLKLREEKLDDLEEIIERRVKGQEYVVHQAVGILKRAIVGMSGLQHSDASAKPRGILFLAGPTGTGKTELAKTITECIFKDERNMIRFDMSEYHEPHSDQRLLGAPPGYVGYEAGGQLTNAVREHPFSVLLFDEIEKAHHSILDKFLQILDDGRITDGRGDTVYFQDCLIIFTSNLGITKPSDTIPGRREVVLHYSPDTPYETVRKTVLDGVRSYFNEELGRPELLNRIGNNILVFDFIREGAVAGILKKQLDAVTFHMEKNQRIRLVVPQGGAAEQKLMQFAIEQLYAEQGGRGIGNMMEERFINPVARCIFDNRIQPGSTLYIKDIIVDGSGVTSVVAERG